MWCKGNLLFWMIGKFPYYCFLLFCFSQKLSVMKMLGVPYSDDEIQYAEEIARSAAKKIADELEGQGAPKGLENKDIIALIAYLQRLGRSE